MVTNETGAGKVTTINSGKATKDLIAIVACFRTDAGSAMSRSEAVSIVKRVLLQAPSRAAT
jgi:hypothetical protein